MRIVFGAALAALVLCAPAHAQTTAEQQREDIEFLRTEYLPRERAFTHETRAAAERILDGLAAQAGTLSQAQLYLGFLRVNAAADNAHSLASFGAPEAIPPGRLPLVTAWFEDAGLVVLRALPPHQDLAGATVLAIEGRPAEEAMAVLRTYFGGAPARRNIMAPGLIGIGGVMQAAGLADTPDALTLRLRLRDGAEIEREIAYIPADPNRAAPWWPMRWWSPEPINGDATPWATAIPAEGLPLYLRDGDSFNRAIALPELNAVYLELKTNEPFREAREFPARAEAVLRQAHAANIIVDLRFSKGGDMRTTAAFFERLPSRLPPGGRIFVIVGRYTFSAGMASAAILLNAAGDRATLVGEDVGDRPRFWSEGESVCAPHSRLCVRYTTGLFDLSQPCTERSCHGDNRRFALVAPLAPTQRTPMTWADYLARRDPAMEAITAQLRQ